jgi:hypothetical protein
MARDNREPPPRPKPQERPEPLIERKDHGEKYPTRVTRPEPWPDPPPPPEPSHQKSSRQP